MKKALSLLLVLLLTSCATLTPERINLLIALAAQAAELAANIWLQQHPTDRKSFEITVDALSNEVRIGNTNMAQYAELLDGLPADMAGTLQGSESAIYISGDPLPSRHRRIFVWDEVTGKAYPATMPMVKATVAGLKRGLAETPPRLPAVVQRASLHGPERALRDLREHSIALQTNELSDAELDAQFEAVKTKLAVRVDYAIEHNVGGTNWTAVGVITNAPAGEWRVRRVR